MNKLPFLTVLFLSLSFASISAQQNPQPFARNYSTEQGLPSPEVYFAFEDSKGYMWFGTDNGASRFDGYDFKNYGASEGLTSNVVFDIMEDTLGQIWFGTMTGEAFFLKGDTILPYRYNHLVLQYKHRYSEAHLHYLGRDGTTFFELDDFGILKISNDGKIDSITTEVTCARLSYQEEGFMETANVYTRYRGHKNYDFWQKKLNQNSQVYLEMVHSDGQRFKFILPEGKGNIGGMDIQKLPNDDYLYISNGDLYGMHRNQILWKRPHLARVINIIIGSNETIWFCQNDGGGLRRYKDIEALQADKYELYFSGLSISNMWEDSRGGYWITTIEKGVFYIPDFQILTYGTACGLPIEYVTSVAFKNKEELFVGLHNGQIYGLSIFDHQLKKLGMGNTSMHTPSLFYDKERELLWAGAFYFEGNNKKYTTYQDPYGSEPVAYNTISFDNIQVNSKRKLYGNGGFSGIQIIDMDQDKLIYSTAETPLGGRYYAIHCDQQDRIWVTNDEGLFELKDSLLFRPPNIPAHPAFHSRIEALDQIRNSIFVLGTKGLGVIIWDRKNIIQITEKDGLTSNMLEDIHVDAADDIWASTLNGLNKINIDNNGTVKVRSYTVANGLPSNEVYKTRTYEEQVWLCTSGGLVNLKESAVDTLAAIPRIQTITVNDLSIEADQNTEFDYEDNNITFKYLTINYRQNGEIPYRYRLAENAAWQNTKNRSVNYPALAKGNYHFEVQAQNQDCYWSDSASYRFSINPPWWDTTWFKALCVIGVGLVGYSVYKYRTNQLRKENERQLQMIDMERQLTDLEKSALQAQMNPHFIFNSLNSIQNFILKNDGQKAVEFLSRFAKLVRHNLNASVEGEVLLEEEVNNLDNYLALEQERFEHRFTYEIAVDESLKNELIEFPPMLVQPYVENAVIHGLSKKMVAGKIEISFQKNQNELLVIVRDNGVGYREDQTDKQNERHKSVGMSITRKRLELLGADPENSVKIETLKNDLTNEVTGTEVKIRINIKTT